MRKLPALCTLAAVVELVSVASAIPTAVYTPTTGNIKITNDLTSTLAAVLLKSGAPGLGEFGTGTAIISAGNQVPGALTDPGDLPGNLVWLNFPVGVFDIGNIVSVGTPIGDLRLEYYDGAILTAPLVQGTVVTDPLLTQTLTFNSPVPGTLGDINGLGTGFTHRLPGTGSEISSSDRNLDLATTPGKLRLTSTLAHFNQAQIVPRRNLPSLDAPGLFLPNVNSLDVSLSVIFEDVALPGLSDELSLYAGLNQNTILRGGFASGNAFRLTINTGSGDVSVLSSPLNTFAIGDDLRLTLSRTA